MRDSKSNFIASHTFNRSALAGAGAGLVTSIAGCPLDVIKTRLQAQEFAYGTLGYKGVWETAQYIYQVKGIRGFYRGLGPTILGYLPTWAIYFTVYDSVKAYFGEAALGGTRIVDPHVPHDRKHTTALHVFSAMAAGAASTICTSPLWVIKTRIMAQPLHEKQYKHTLDCFLTIYRHEGFKAFYRGLLTSLLGISHVAVQFPLYEQFKEWAVRSPKTQRFPKYFSRVRGVWCGVRNQIEQSRPNEPLPYYTILACSGGAKMAASMATYPHEVIRTRLQMQKRPLRHPELPGSVNPRVHYHGILQTAARIVQEETWKGLYKGLSINLVRTVPSSAVTMLTYVFYYFYPGGIQVLTQVGGDGLLAMKHL
ncbi:hypothetical protein FRC17_001243 [Serendipita sp. 399]|nr:hypothetical protein FRC17_001243 [Serendipita sp. 399]